MKLIGCVLSIFAVVTCSSCCRGLSQGEPEIYCCGSFEGDRYHDASGTFSIVVPACLQGDVEERVDPAQSLSCAIFDDGMGCLLRVEVVTLPQELASQLVKQHKANGKMLSGFFDHVVLAPIIKEFPGTKAVNQEVLRGNNGEALFATVTIPCGSTLINAETGRALDSYRGYLLFFEGNQIVVLSYQPSELHPVENILDTLLQIRFTYHNASCEFIKCAQSSSTHH